MEQERFKDIPRTARGILVWLLKAAVMGGGSSLIMWLIMARGQVYWGPMLRTMAIGVIFCVVLWGLSVFSLPWTWRESPKQGPQEMALHFYLRWGAVFFLGYAICVLSVRLLLGINILRDPVGTAIGSLMGLAIAAIIMGYHALVHQVRLARELALAQARAQALALQAQLSPHTLFNSLNTIAALIPDDPVAAEASVMKLSRLLRKILAALEQERWTLGEEFALLEDLVALEHLRFGDRLISRFDLPESEAGRMIPPLLLLPLVENSLKHGFRPKVGTCHLTVSANERGVSVLDDGVGCAPEAGRGVGLRTVLERLRAIGGTLDWPPVESGCRVEVRFP